MSRPSLSREALLTPRVLQADEFWHSLHCHYSHILRASVHNDVAVGWICSFAVLNSKKGLFKCEGRCKQLLGTLRRTRSDGAFHHNTVDEYSLKSLQKRLGLSTCIQAAFKRKCKTRHSVLKPCIMICIIESVFVVYFSI